MKVIIAGGRDLTDYALVERAVSESGFAITEVVSGGQRGIDLLGEEWARRNHVPIKRFPADWARYGKSAGPIRNQQMAEYVGSEGGLVAVWSGGRGTKDMINVAKRLGLSIYVLEVK